MEIQLKLGWSLLLSAYLTLALPSPCWALNPLERNPPCATGLRIRNLHEVKQEIMKEVRAADQGYTMTCYGHAAYHLLRIHLLQRGISADPSPLDTTLQGCRGSYENKGGYAYAVLHNLRQAPGGPFIYHNTGQSIEAVEHLQRTLAACKPDSCGEVSSVLAQPCQLFKQVLKIPGVAGLSAETLKSLQWHAEKEDLGRVTAKIAEQTLFQGKRTLELPPYNVHVYKDPNGSAESFTQAVSRFFPPPPTPSNPITLSFCSKDTAEKNCGIGHAVTAVGTREVCCPTDPSHDCADKDYRMEISILNSWGEERPNWHRMDSMSAMMAKYPGISSITSLEACTGEACHPDQILGSSPALYLAQAKDFPNLRKFLKTHPDRANILKSEGSKILQILLEENPPSNIEKILKPYLKLYDDETKPDLQTLKQQHLDQALSSTLTFSTSPSLVRHLVTQGANPLTVMRDFSNLERLKRLLAGGVSPTLEFSVGDQKRSLLQSAVLARNLTALESMTHALSIHPAEKKDGIQKAFDSAVLSGNLALIDFFLKLKDSAEGKDIPIPNTDSAYSRVFAARMLMHKVPKLDDPLLTELLKRGFDVPFVSIAQINREALSHAAYDYLKSSWIKAGKTETEFETLGLPTPRPSAAAPEISPVVARAPIQERGPALPKSAIETKVESAQQELAQARAAAEAEKAKKGKTLLARAQVDERAAKTRVDKAEKALKAALKAKKEQEKEELKAKEEQEKEELKAKAKREKEERKAGKYARDPKDYQRL